MSKTRKQPPRHRSMGELISTFCFFGMAAYLFLNGLEYRDEGFETRSYLAWAAAFLCFLGGMRFSIAAAWQNMRGE